MARRSARFNSRSGRLAWRGMCSQSPLHWAIGTRIAVNNALHWANKEAPAPEVCRIYDVSVFCTVAAALRPVQNRGSCRPRTIPRERSHFPNAAYCWPGLLGIELLPTLLSFTKEGIKELNYGFIRRNIGRCYVG